MRAEERYPSAAEVKKALAPPQEPETTFLPRSPQRQAVNPMMVSGTASAPVLPPVTKGQPWGQILMLVLAILAFGGLGIYLLMASRDNPATEIQNNPAVTATPAQVSVPDVTRMSQDAAQKVLAQIQLTMDKQGREPSSQVPTDQVDRQDPPAGSVVAVNSPVKVWFSSGPAYVQTPDVKEMSVEQARKFLQESGLSVGQVTNQNSDTIPKGYVIQSAPRAGFKAGPKQAVDLVVSDGPPPAPTPPPTPTPPPAQEPSANEPNFSVDVPVPDDGKPHQVKVTVQQTDGSLATAYDRSSQEDAKLTVQAPNASSIKATVDGANVNPDIEPLPTESGGSSGEGGAQGSVPGASIGPVANTGPDNRAGDNTQAH